MPNPISKATLGDDYTAAGTIQDVWLGSGGWFNFGPEADAIFQVQYASDPRSSGQGLSSWTPEQHAYANSVWTLPPGAFGVRAKNYTAGQNATMSGSIAARIVPSASPVAFGTSRVSAATYLGEFTVAQWPPVSPTEGNRATLYGTLSGGDPYAWLLEYQPSALGTAKPWRPPPGVTLGYAYKYAITAVPGAGYSNVESIAAILAGDWEFAWQLGVWGASSAGTIRAGLTLASAGTPATTADAFASAQNVAGSASQAAQAFTLAITDTLYLVGKIQSGNPDANLHALGLRPKQL